MFLLARSGITVRVRRGPYLGPSGEFVLVRGIRFAAGGVLTRSPIGRPFPKPFTFNCSVHGRCVIGHNFSLVSPAGCLDASDPALRASPYLQRFLALKRLPFLRTVVRIGLSGIGPAVIVQADNTGSQTVPLLRVKGTFLNRTTHPDLGTDTILGGWLVWVPGERSPYARRTLAEYYRKHQ